MLLLILVDTFFFYREGTPRSVLEALAKGRPIITTDAPGCRQTVIDNVNGFWFPKSSESLANAMIRLLQSFSYSPNGRSKPLLGL